MRLFFALDLPDALRSACAQLADAIRSSLAEREIEVRWTSAEHYHLTVRFLGDCDASTAVELRSALSNLDASPVVVQPYGPGVLPSRLSPRVLTLAMEQTPSISTLHRSVASMVRDLEVQEEETSFRPHVTLGRLSDADPTEVHHMLRETKEVELPTVEISALTLFESIRDDSGVRYDVVDDVTLT